MPDQLSRRRPPAVLGAVLVVLALVASACIVPFTAPNYSFTVQSDVVYGQGEVDDGGTFDDLLLDLYVPDLTEPRPMPLMLMIHGGGFVGGSKTNGNVVASAEEYAPPRLARRVDQLPPRR